MPSRRISTVATILLLLGAPTAAKVHDVTPEERMMGAAALILSAATDPAGSLQVLSATLARSDDGVVFRKLGPCRYGMEDRRNGQVRTEDVDFAALTGRYRVRAPMFGTTLVLAGTNAHAVCYAFAGRRGCSTDLPLSNVEGWLLDRAILELSYMQANGCGASSAAHALR